jgi:hypothetical protein
MQYAIEVVGEEKSVERSSAGDLVIQVAWRSSKQSTLDLLAGAGCYATANGITCDNENKQKKKQLGELQGKAWVIHVTVAKLVKKN